MKFNPPLFVLLFIFVMAGLCPASQIDFSWSAPKNYLHNKGTGAETRYIIWFYNLVNTSEKPMEVPVEIFLTTDTGEKRLNTYYPDIMENVASLDEEYKEGKKYKSASMAKGELTAKSTKHCVAMFEDVDPNTKRFDIFVTGISHFFLWRSRMIDYSYKITYEREYDRWKLIEHGISKDSSNRSQEW